MKKLYLLTALMLGCIGMQAQDSYMNDRLTNNSAGLYGTARFVGMGGAMGALGADISTMSWNPAGIGLMRRSDIAITAGAGWDQKGTESVNRAHGTFDQLGAVLSVPMSDRGGLRYLNIGFNYQKKLDFNNSFYASGKLNGLSQMDQICASLNAFGSKDAAGDLFPSLPAMAGDFYSDDPNTPYSFLQYDSRYGTYANTCRGRGYDYWQHTWGGLNSFDFNISGNIDDRFFWGFTFGFDQMRYRMANEYFEMNNGQEYDANLHSYVDGDPGNYSVYNDQEVNGYGMNAKIGIIFRPIQDNPFRVAIALETPTKYCLRTNTSFQIEDHVSGYYTNVDATDAYYGHPFRYALSTPWKLRLGMGSTISDYLAFDVDYEFANSSRTKMGYFRNYDNDDVALFQSRTDRSMYDLTKRNFKGTHTLRMGVEGKVSSKIAVRAGFNLISSSQKKDPTFSQLGKSESLDNATGTYYMRMKPTLIGTFGAGYRWKHAYIDVAYKGMAQKAEFYPFDDADARIGLPETGYNPSEMKDNKLQPSTAKLGRHQITATLGLRF